MTKHPDFEFEIGRTSTFRGNGVRALLALAIVQWRLPVFKIVSLIAAYKAMPEWIWPYVLAKIR